MAGATRLSHLSLRSSSTRHSRRTGGLGATQEFARLFMVPGMDHCGIGTEGPGISDTGIDPLTALEQWVEEGKAPDQLVATKTAILLCARFASEREFRLFADRSPTMRARTAETSWTFHRP